MRVWAGVTIAILCLTSPVRAADEAAMDGLRVIVGRMLDTSGENISLAAVREKVVNQFHSQDIDGIPGLSQSDYDLAEQINFARMRASSITHMLAFDLDGDGRITRDEVRLALTGQSRQPLSNGGARVRPTDEQAREILDRLVEAPMTADTNHDGVVTFEELRALAATRSRPQKSQPYFPVGLSQNGTLTLADLNAALDLIFREIDSDGGDRVTLDKISAYRMKVRSIEKVVQERSRREAHRAEIRQNLAKCGLPPPPKDALIAMVGAYEGAALSNVAVGDDSQETRAAQVDIQEGDKPLYILLTSHYHTIWLFSGATDRVVQVVALSGSSKDRSGSGVTGIAKGKVVTKEAQGCFPYFSNEQQAGQQREAFEAYFGRMPDIVTASYQLSRVRLPGGMVSVDHPYPKSLPLPVGNPGRAVYDEAKRFYPLGAADIDPATVVASLPARRYTTLPGNLGLAYLVDKGVLEVSGYSQAFQIGNTTFVGDMQIAGANSQQVRRFMVPRGFRIVGPMTFPAGLFGAHGVEFTVAKGARMPDGNPGHSKVVCETTGAPLKVGDICE